MTMRWQTATGLWVGAGVVCFAAAMGLKALGWTTAAVGVMAVGVLLVGVAVVVLFRSAP